MIYKNHLLLTRADNALSFLCGTGSSSFSECRTGSGSSYLKNADPDPDPAYLSGRQKNIVQFSPVLYRCTWNFCEIFFRLKDRTLFLFLYFFISLTMHKHITFYLCHFFTKSLYAVIRLNFFNIIFRSGNKWKISFGFLTVRTSFWTFFGQKTNIILEQL